MSQRSGFDLNQGPQRRNAEQRGQSRRRDRAGSCFLFARVFRDRRNSLQHARCCVILSKDVFSLPLLIQVKARPSSLWEERRNKPTGVFA